MHLRLFFILLTVLGKAATILCQPTVYVKFDAAGKNDGSSWQDAYTDLGIAIAKTASGRIWVARGVYLPSLDSSYRIPANRREATFHLHNGLQLFGGFAGSETTTSQRDFLNNPTVLSGDFEQNDVQDYRIHQLWLHPTRQDNAVGIVNIVNAGSVVLDGFVIQGGNTQPTGKNLPSAKDSCGGGINIYATGANAFNDVTVRNCRFISNAACWGSGAIYHFCQMGASSRLSLINCLFFNSQSVFAGGIGNCIRRHSEMETTVTNCTFARNYALYCGGSVSTTIEPLFKPAVNRAIIRNSIFWGNDANGCRPDVDDYNAETSVWHCAMENPYGGVDNFKMKPFFKNAPGADGIAGSSDDDFSIAAFCPDEGRDSCLPPVIFNSFLIRGKPVQLAADLNRDNLVSLQAEENSFGIEVAMVGFTLTPEKAVEYRLDGYDNDWRQAKQTDTIFYKDLRGGEYRFRLRAAGMAAEKTLLLKIAPYFWQTTWFKWLALAFISITIASAYIIRQNQRLRKKKIELERAQTLADFQQKTAESEMRALRAQMNPHFIFNSLNSINAYILRNEGKTANAYLTEFAHLVRQILDNSARETISLEQEIEFLQSYLRAESMRLENKLTWEIKVAGEVDTFETEIPSMILQPYVENAVWHGISLKQSGGKVTIWIEREKEGLCFIIEDNGVGRDRARTMNTNKTHVSKGLKITEERLALFDQKNGTKSTVKTIDLQDKNGVPCGTRVEIRIE